MTQIINQLSLDMNGIYKSVRHAGRTQKKQPRRAALIAKIGVLFDKSRQFAEKVKHAGIYDNCRDQ